MKNRHVCPAAYDAGQTRLAAGIRLPILVGRLRNRRRAARMLAELMPAQLMLAHEAGEVLTLA
jgi:hypothetical protein